MFAIRSIWGLLSRWTINCPDLRGKWSVSYSRDIIIRGGSSGEKLFVVYYGDPSYELRSDIIPDLDVDINRLKKRVVGSLYVYRQFLNIVYGVFYWTAEGNKGKHIYDVTGTFIDKTVAKIEFMPPRKLLKYHRIFADGNEKIPNDHIVGLMKVNNAVNQLWGATTSIDVEGRNVVFASLPYFTASQIDQVQNGLSQAMSRPKMLSKIDVKWLTLAIIGALSALAAIIRLIWEL